MLDMPSTLVIFAIPGNFPGMSVNSREFPIPGNEIFVPESSSLLSGNSTEELDVLKDHDRPF